MSRWLGWSSFVLAPSGEIEPMVLTGAPRRSTSLQHRATVPGHR